MRRANCGLRASEHGVLGNVQQHAVADCVGGNDVGLFHEHQCFTEAVAGADDLDDLFVALRRQEAEFDLAEDDHVKADTWIAALEDCAAARDVVFGGAGSHQRQLLR